MRKNAGRYRMSQNKYKTLLSNTMLISLGTFGSKILVFLMVRFYTGYLTTSDYGTADLITQSANLLLSVISMGITDGVFRFAISHVKERKRIFSIGLYTITLGGLLLLGILPLLGLWKQMHPYLWLIGLYIMASCYHTLCAQFIRAEGKTALFAVQGMINTLLVIVLNIVFLAVLHMGITGYVLSIVLADVFCALLLFVREKLWRQLTLHPGMAHWREMLAYSIPMIPATVFWWITSVSDRYMVTGFISEAANGVYAVSYKLPTLLSIVSTIFMEAWQFSAVAESVGDKREHTRFFSRVWAAFQAVMFLAAGAITALAKPLVSLLTATDEFYQAWLFVPVLSAAMVYSSLVSFLGSVYMVEKNSMRTFLTAMIGAVLNIVLNLILIPGPMGVQGAAIATCVSYFVVFLIRAADVRRFIPFQLYPVGLAENSVLLLVQIVFMVLELPGWMLAQAVCLGLMLWLNRTPLLSTFKRVLSMRK